MQLRPFVRSLFPASVCGAELVDFSQASALYPEESALVANAVEKRIAEFRAGRHCAREALRALGREPGAILADGRAPIWPDGIVGSITHCTGYCGAVVAGSFASGIGFDAQTVRAVSLQAWSAIASPRELECDPLADWRTIAFSAKEAFYKAQYSITRSWLGFDEVSIEPLGVDAFRVRLQRDISVLGPYGTTFVGRYAQDDGLVFAAVCLRRDG